MPKPAIGRIVHYTLSELDAASVNRRRDDAHRHIGEHVNAATGVQLHTGNAVSSGDVYPMIITRVWGDGEFASVNGQVFLDGNDLLWVTSVSCGEGQRQFRWPTRD